MNGHAAWWLSCTYETNDHVHTRLTKETFTWIKNDINAIDTYLAARGWTWWMLSLVPGCTLDMSTRAIHKQTVEWWIPVLKWAKPFVLRKKRENSRGEPPSPLSIKLAAKNRRWDFTYTDRNLNTKKRAAGLGQPTIGLKTHQNSGSLVGSLREHSWQGCWYRAAARYKPWVVGTESKNTSKQYEGSKMKVLALKGWRAARNLYLHWARQLTKRLSPTYT